MLRKQGKGPLDKFLRGTETQEKHKTFSGRLREKGGVGRGSEAAVESSDKEKKTESAGSLTYQEIRGRVKSSGRGAGKGEGGRYRKGRGSKTLADFSGWGVGGVRFH